MNRLFLMTIMVAVFGLTSCVATPANPAESKINWMTWEQVQQAQKKQQRKVVVDIYTGWCGWCKKMDATTYEHPVIVKYINDHYYAVKFDAETQQVIHFQGKDYKWVSGGRAGYNELASKLLNNQFSFPTTVYLDEQFQILSPVPGYLDAKTFEGIINFFGSDSYKSQQWEEYQTKFKGQVK